MKIEQLKYTKICIGYWTENPSCLSEIRNWSTTSPGASMVFTEESNYTCPQVFQNRVLGNIVNALWYIRKEALHRDLQMRTVKEEINKVAKLHDIP